MLQALQYFIYGSNLLKKNKLTKLLYQIDIYLYILAIKLIEFS